MFRSVFAGGLRSALAACLGVGILSCGGCSCSKAGPQRRAIHGKVVSTREVNSISLQPIGELAAPAVSTTVTNGMYRFQKEDGPVPGQYRVVFGFVDVTGGFSGSKKELVAAPPPVKNVAPPPPPPDVAIIVPADGPLELDILIP